MCPPKNKTLEMLFYRAHAAFTDYSCRLTGRRKRGAPRYPTVSPAATETPLNILRTPAYLRYCISSPNMRKGPIRNEAHQSKGKQESRQWLCYVCVKYTLSRIRNLYWTSVPVSYYLTTGISVGQFWSQFEGCQTIRGRIMM